MSIILTKERAAPDVELARIASLTEGYSGSDLREVVRAAALAPIREAYRKEAEMHRSGQRGGTVTPRPIVTADLLEAVRVVKPTGQAARDYLSFQRNTVTSFTATSPAKPAVAATHFAPAAGILSRAAPSTPKTPGPRGGSPGEQVGMASPGHVDCTFGPSAKANGLNLARAIESVVKVREREKYTAASNAEVKKALALAATAPGGGSPDEAATQPSALEAIL